MGNIVTGWEEMREDAEMNQNAFLKNESKYLHLKVWARGS